MNKTKKSLMLPAQLASRAKEVELRTGITFTRQCVAALLMFLHPALTGIDRQSWIAAAVALQAGSITLDSVPHFVQLGDGRSTAGNEPTTDPPQAEHLTSES